MKREYLLCIAVTLASVLSCQEPEFVEPTAVRQGITSLTAYFTSGDFANQEMGRCVVEDAAADADYYEIEIPYYYPEETDNATLVAMSRARVRAELAKNCSLYPPLTIMNLSEPNTYTYTNQYGEKKEIVIKGKRVKSAKCNIISLDLYDASGEVVVEGFVNDEKKVVYLLTVEDISAVQAKVVPSAHATVETALDGVMNFEDGVEITILAHDGKTRQTYVTEKRAPSKIDYGFNQSSVRQLFDFEPYSRLKDNGFPRHMDYVYASMASIRRKLVMCFGGKAEPVLPLVLDGQTGVFVGNINAGNIPAGDIASVTNDDAGNMLLFSHAGADENMKIWTTTSVDEAPVLFHEFKNPSMYAFGYHAKCIGDIHGDAIITISHESVPQTETTVGAEASHVTRMYIRAGVVTEVKCDDFASLGFSWGAGADNTPKAVAASPDLESGLYISYYYGQGSQKQTLGYINYNRNLAASLSMEKYAVDDVGSWKHLNCNCMDSRQFNNARYMAHFLSHHFPAWAPTPQLHVYDVSNPVLFASGMTVLSQKDMKYYQPNNIDEKIRVGTGDVILAPSADGFKIYVYYYDHNSGLLGGYSADCVKMED